MGMANPIKDLNAKQWDRVEEEVRRMLSKGLQGEDVPDHKRAEAILNTIFGAWCDTLDDRLPPPRGYDSELIDGVASIWRVRLKRWSPS